MEATPFFTIGIPVYNAEKYLSLCLDSILNQSFRDYELILVNDGSKDNSLNICKAYQEKDSRIIIIDQENGGVSAATNRVLDAARGQYIYLIDNDDEMFDGVLETVHQYLIEHPCDILHGGYYVQAPSEEPKLRLYRFDSVTQGFNGKNEFLKYYIDHDYTPVMWTKFVNNAFWRGTGVKFKTEYDGCQDSDVTSRLMERAQSIHYIDNVFLTWYHPREGSQSTNWSLRMLENYWRFTANSITDVFQSPGVERTTKEGYLKKLLYLRGISLWRLADYALSDLDTLASLIQPIRKYLRISYAKDFRHAVILGLIRNLGVKKTHTVILIERKIRHCLTSK